MCPACIASITLALAATTGVGAAVVNIRRKLEKRDERQDRP
jgi:hypothetical protein